MHNDILSVLVVDDDPGMRSGVARALKHFSFTIPETSDEISFDTTLASSGQEALRIIEVDNPSLVLLDYKLPDITGFDVLDQINQNDHNRLVIMMTAYASIETAVRATKHGAFDFLAKPFTPDELRKTVQKAAEQVLLRISTHRLAEEKRQLRFQFISVLSHELKAPLAAIDSYLNVMKQGYAGANISDYKVILERCSIRTEQMQKLIYDLLDLTRIESGLKARDFSEVDIHAVLQQCVETIQPEAIKLNLAMDITCESPLLFYCDMSEIMMIFNNLLSNAVKYNIPNGSVAVCVTQKEDVLRLSVSDTGIGMTEEEADKLFRDFVRIRNEKTKDILGSGLGLSTVKKITTLYGGDVAVRSEPGKGSTFTVKLKKAVQ
jgi:two-component system, sensor histidine kinase and response regulator